MVFYFHDILYNGNNFDNATSAIVGAAWGNRTHMAGFNNFGDMVVFDDPRQQSAFTPGGAGTRVLSMT